MTLSLKKGKNHSEDINNFAANHILAKNLPSFRITLVKVELNWIQSAMTNISDLAVHRKRHLSVFLNEIRITFFIFSLRLLTSLAF